MVAELKNRVNDPEAELETKAAAAAVGLGEISDTQMVVHNNKIKKFFQRTTSQVLPILWDNPMISVRHSSLGREQGTTDSRYTSVGGSFRLQITKIEKEK
jgi:hypothetical protein